MSYRVSSVSDFGRYSHKNTAKGTVFSLKHVKDKKGVSSRFRVAASHVIAVCIALIMVAIGLWISFEISGLDKEIEGLLAQSQSLVKASGELEARYLEQCDEKNLKALGKKLGLGPAGAGQRVVIEE